MGNIRHAASATPKLGEGGGGWHKASVEGGGGWLAIARVGDAYFGLSDAAHVFEGGFCHGSAAGFQGLGNASCAPQAAHCEGN